MATSRRQLQLLLLLLIASSILLALAILGDWLPLLRGPAPETSEWYWPYLLRPVGRWWPSILAALLTLLVGAWWLSLRTPNRIQNVTALLALFGLALLIQGTLIYADRQDIAAELVDRTLSNQASGFFEPAAEIDDIDEALSNYPQKMPTFMSEHARTHPPGLILSNWATIELVEKSHALSSTLAQSVLPLRCTDLWLYQRSLGVAAALGVWAVLPLLFAASTVFPAFALARVLLTSYAVRLATLLVMTLPALLLFAPKSVQLFAPLSLLMFFLFHTGISRNSTVRMLIAGVVVSILTFLSFGNAALLLLLALFVLLTSWFKARLEHQQPFLPDATMLIKQGLAFIIGLSSVWALYSMIWGAAPWGLALTGLDQHYRLVTSIRRYEWWIGWNLLDLLVYTGWPTLLGFLGALLLLFGRWRSRQLGSTDALALALALFIVVLNFSGTTRGETGRLWLFFTPLLAYPAASFWQAALPGRKFATIIIAMQLLILLCLGWAWRPVRAVIVIAEPPRMVQEKPQFPADVQFDAEPITLSGYSLPAAPVASGEQLALTLFWSSGGPASRPYTVFTHLVNDAGAIVAQQDNWPVGGQWPPTCWREGDLIVDRYQLAIPSGAGPGRLRLITGLYDADSGARLPTEDGRDSIELTTIEIEAR